MSAEPEHFRAARIPIPRLPFPAILFFAVAGLGGALFLTYTSSFTGAEPIKAAPSSAKDVPIYAVPAVPFTTDPEAVPTQETPSARVATSAPSGPRPAETADFADTSASSEPVLFAEADRKLKGFNRFSDFGGASNFMALNATTFGMAAQSNAPGYLGPEDNGLAAPVPEPSTWLCGVALLALLLTRGLHASWHRHHRRTANKTNSTRP